MSIFLDIKDLMLLTGSDNYKSAQKQHKAIRDALAGNKRRLTIREYCRFEGLNYEEIKSALEEAKQKIRLKKKEKSASCA